MKKNNINNHHQVNADGSSWEKHIVKVMCSSLQKKKKPAQFAPKTLFGVPQGRALGLKCFHCWLVFAAQAVISSAADKAWTSCRTIASASRPPKAQTGTFYASAVYLRYKYFTRNNMSVTVTLAWVSAWTFWNLSRAWNEYGPKRRLGGRWFVSSIS